jgi:hypothetical protein
MNRHFALRRTEYPSWREQKREKDEAPAIAEKDGGVWRKLGHHHRTPHQKD